MCNWRWWKLGTLRPQSDARTRKTEWGGERGHSSPRVRCWGIMLWEIGLQWSGPSVKRSQVDAEGEGYRPT